MPVTSREELEQLMRDSQRVDAGQDPDWKANGDPVRQENLREYRDIWRKAEQE